MASWKKVLVEGTDLATTDVSNNHVGISDGTTTTDVTLGNNITFVGGTDLSVDVTGSNVTFAYNGSAEANQNAFSTIQVSGQSDVEADSATDTLIFVEESGVTSIVTTPLSDAVTFGIANGGIDTIKLANLAVETAKIDDGAVTFAKIAGGTYITSTETIASNETVDNQFPTVKAVVDYVATEIGDIVDGDTTYTLPVTNGSNAATITLTDSDAGTDPVTFTAGTAITVVGDASAADIEIAVAQNGIGASQLNVGGNGSSGQMLVSDGDGSFSWVTPGGVADAHSGITGAADVDNSGVAYVQDITMDEYGHVTAIGSTSIPNAGTAITTGLVTNGTQSFGGAKTFASDVTVSGNLTVVGNTELQSTTNTTIADRFISLNQGGSAATAGIVFDGADSVFAWDNANGRFGFAYTGGDMTAAGGGYTNLGFVASTYGGSTAPSDSATLAQNGNIYTRTTGEIYIYS